MKDFIGTNEVGQIISKSFNLVKKEDESYQEFLNRANSIINHDPEDENLRAMDFRYIGKNAANDLEIMNHKDTNEILKDHNTIETLNMMINDIGDEDLIVKMARFRQGRIMPAIYGMRKIVNKDVIFNIPLDDLLDKFKNEHIVFLW